jgi:hypothetical protein
MGQRVAIFLGFMSIILLCVLGYSGGRTLAQGQLSATLPNPAEQRNQMIEELRAIKALLREQNAILREQNQLLRALQNQKKDLPE